MEPKDKEFAKPKLPISRYAMASLIVYLIFLPSIQAPLAYKAILYSIVVALASKALVDVKEKKVRGKILSIILVVLAGLGIVLSILIALKQ